MANRKQGFYAVVLNFEIPHASVGFWNGQEFIFAGTEDTFPENEVLWIGPELTKDQLFPKDVQARYNIMESEAKVYHDKEIIQSVKWN